MLIHMYYLQRQKKRKASGKKAVKEANDAQSQDGTENSSVTGKKVTKTITGVLRLV